MSEPREVDHAYDTPLKRQVKRLSLDEIDMALNEIAQDADAGPDRFRALKMLRTAEGANVVLPEPLDQNEVIERGTRLLKGMGKEAARISYRRAFPKDRHDDGIEAPVTIFSENDDLLSDAQREICRKASSTLKNLNRVFPEIKRAGIPKGFPRRQGPIAQKAFCYRVAVKAMLDRINRTMTEALPKDGDAPKNDVA